MDGSLVMIVSAIYVGALVLAGIAAWKRWLDMRWQWIGGYLLLCLVLPLLPLEQAPSAQAERVIERDATAAEARTDDLPPRVSVDTGRDFEAARERFAAEVEARAEENAANQQPEEM